MASADEIRAPITGHILCALNNSCSEFENNVTTSSYGQPTLPIRNEDLAKMEIAIQGGILCLTIGGNGAVLTMLVSLARRKDLGRMYTLIAHLSIADLFVAAFNLIPQLVWDVTYRFHGGKILCKLVKFFQVLAMYASAYVLVSTAIDRYMAICHPMRSHTWTSTTAHHLVAIAWLIALVFSLPQLYIFDFVEVLPNSGVYDCWENFTPSWTLPLYITWFTVAIYIIPLFLLMFIYARICAVVWRSVADRKCQSSAVVLTSSSEPYQAVRNGAIEPEIDRRHNSSSGSPSFLPRTSTSKVFARQQSRDAQSNPISCSVATGPAPASESEESFLTQSQAMDVFALANQPNVGVSRAKTRTVKLTMAVVIGYLLCWGPFFFAQMWWAWDPFAPFEGSNTLIYI